MKASVNCSIRLKTLNHKPFYFFHDFMAALVSWFDPHLPMGSRRFLKAYNDGIDQCFSGCATLAAGGGQGLRSLSYHSSAADMASLSASRLALQMTSTLNTLSSFIMPSFLHMMPSSLTQCINKGFFFLISKIISPWDLITQPLILIKIDYYLYHHPKLQLGEQYILTRIAIPP